MDNSYLYYFTSDAELDYRRQRAMGRPVKPSRRRKTRSPWRRERGVEPTT
jgi:hypothetical protein